MKNWFKSIETPAEPAPTSMSKLELAILEQYKTKPDLWQHRVMSVGVVEYTLYQPIAKIGIRVTSVPGSNPLAVPKEVVFYGTANEHACVQAYCGKEFTFSPEFSKAIHAVFCDRHNKAQTEERRKNIESTEYALKEAFGLINRRGL